MTDFAAILADRMEHLLLENEKGFQKDCKVRSKNVSTRIESFRNNKMTDAERMLYSVESIFDALEREPLLRILLRKDPSRQTVHESTQIQHLKRHTHPDIVKLPAGRGGTYFQDNTLTVAHPRGANATKTLDAWSPSKQLYCVMKYTAAEGGSQDNQYRDVQHFAREMVSYLDAHPDAPESFALFLDGPYYTEKRRELLKAMVPTKWAGRIVVTSANMQPSLSPQ